MSEPRRIEGAGQSYSLLQSFKEMFSRPRDITGDRFVTDENRTGFARLMSGAERFFFTPISHALLRLFAPSLSRPSAFSVASNEQSAHATRGVSLATYSSTSNGRYAPLFPEGIFHERRVPAYGQIGFEKHGDIEFGSSGGSSPSGRITGATPPATPSATSQVVATRTPACQLFVRPQVPVRTLCCRP